VSMFVKWIRRSRARLSLIYCQARQQILNLMVCLVGQSTVHPITSTHSLTIFSKLNTSNRNFHYSPCLNWWTCGCHKVCSVGQPIGNWQAIYSVHLFMSRFACRVTDRNIFPRKFLVFVSKNHVQQWNTGTTCIKNAWVGLQYATASN
jgi:hypothetical protein